MNTKNGTSCKSLILIPCYNCGESVIPVIEACKSFSNEIITVNDGSTDHTVKYLQKSDTDTIGWDQNRGKGAALIEGFRYCLEKKDWDVLITMDSDGQHDPQDLPRFLERYKDKNEDFIIGRRDFSQSNVPPLRRNANQFSSWLIAKVFGVKLDDIQCGYRLHTRNVLENALPHLTSHGFAMETEIILLLHQMEFRLGEVDIRCVYSSESQSRSTWKPLVDGWRIFKVCWHAFWRGKKKRDFI